MRVTIRYFAGARDLATCDEETVEVQGSVLSQRDLKAHLAERHPRLRGYLDRIKLALNGDFAPSEVAIQDGDEVDVLPPVAGGSAVALCEITDEVISVDRVWQSVAHDSAGGIDVFIGVVRDHADGRQVSRLDYEAHASLAHKEMRRILESIAAEHPHTVLSAVHRVGSLRVGDLAVVVAASAPHREQAFLACRSAIEHIKETVPIWKKEWNAEGDANWVNLDLKEPL